MTIPISSQTLALKRQWVGVHDEDGLIMDEPMHQSNDFRQNKMPKRARQLSLLAHLGEASSQRGCLGDCRPH